MLKHIRQIIAVIVLVLITLLFLDFTGTIHRYFGWLTRVQLVEAILAANFVAVGALVVLTLLFGRLYCSVICPLGIMQDGFARLGKKAKKNRYSYSPAKTVLRIVMFVIMAVAMIAGIGSLVALLSPYAAYGRIAQSLLAPVWQWGNNLLASWAEAHQSYAFYSVDVWLKGVITLVVAVVTIVALAILAWRNGRTYCNTICPVGTALGWLARFSLFRPVIDTSKCNRCGLCARNCKGACIDSKQHKIDYSRCVVCFDCIKACHQGAISYSLRRNKDVRKEQEPGADKGRREFLAVAGTIAVAAAAKAQEKTVDGGLAVIAAKKAPKRATRIVPPGAVSLNHLSSHCTACQLCVSACPNGVLRPSLDPESLMQPEASYERGYCRPECTRCSHVCPAGAILPISREEKSSVQVGHAVWVRENCIPLTEGVSCGNCARHCPVGAITMVPSVPGDENSPKIPAVNAERCIGCGACENLCPSRPFSAIYVEGHERHRTV